MLLLVMSAALPEAQQANQPPVFRSAREVVSIDVVVRDRDGNVVRGLTQGDFEIREDGRPQELLNFTFQEIPDAPAPVAGARDLLAGAEAKMTEPARGDAGSGTLEPMAADALAGRRLIVLLFDVSSMQPEDVQRAVDSARQYAADQMSAADLVAVAAVGSTLDVLTDFTGERERVEAALARLASTEGLATDAAAASTVETDEAAAAEEPAAAEATEIDLFNNDVRLRALRALAETLAPIEQKKAILYFSAGMQRSGQDNLVELRSAIDAAVRAHVAIYPIDTRGLQAVVPGGDARQASGRGRGSSPDAASPSSSPGWHPRRTR